MKITIEKNLAFSNQPKPLLSSEVQKKIKPVKAGKRLEESELDITRFAPMLPGSEIETQLLQRKDQKKTSHELRINIKNFNYGEHVFPPNVKTVAIKSLGNKSSKFRSALEIPAMLPKHLEMRPLPKPLPKELMLPPYIRASQRETVQARGNQATTIFAPDNRRVFNDTAYPWCTCGRVDTPLGQSSGVMVGPRHMLTVSHGIQWNNNNTAGWVRFRPAFFNGSEPFGDAWGTRIYSKYKVTGPTVDWIEGMYDYVVVVFDRNIGNLTGWMGSRGYTDSWDGGRYWSHIGYPGDLTGGNRPTFENNIALDGAWWQFDSHEAMSHRADVWPGQSGGPFFGWWSGEVGPRIVAVQSSQNSSENNASGGQDMVDLIIRARNENP